MRRAQFAFLLLLTFVPLTLAFQSALEPRIARVEQRLGTIEAYLFATPTQEVIYTFTPSAIATLIPTLTPSPTATFTPSFTPELECWEVVVDRLNIRLSPRNNAERVGVLTRGEQISIIDMASQQVDSNTLIYFFAFEREKKKVWAANKYVRIVGEDVVYMKAC